MKVLNVESVRLKLSLVHHIILITIFFFSYSCKKSSLTDTPEVKQLTDKQVVIPENPDLITIEVSFTAPVSNPSAIITPLKYNKTSVINFEFDDNPSSAYPLYQYLNTQTFSSGTGKNIKFTAGVAVNSRGNYNNGDLWESYQGNLSKQQAIEIISGGWTLENHGFYHSVLNSGDNFGYGKPVGENIRENTKNVFEKTGYKMRTLVVPSNDKGYLMPAFDQGIIATTSTNSFEGFQSFPLYGDYVDISEIPESKIHLRRDFNDNWDAQGINSIKTKLTTLFNKSNNKERVLYRLGTHLANLEAFKTLSEHIHNTSNDKTWVTTMQEMVEYFQLKNSLIKSESFVNGKLIISLDISKVDKETLFKDMTLMVNSSTSILDIKITNAKHSSFNSNGLINLSF